jgi:hypothetical protein
MNDQTTPAERYEAHIDAIMNLLEEIRSDVAMHNVLFDRNGRRSWGFVGDLSHVEEQLQEVSNFLNNQE